MKKILIIVLVFQFGYLYSQNPFWEGEDKRLIKKITELCDKPNELNQFFAEKNKLPKQEYLGFRYLVKSYGIGAGYISISCDFYFQKDSLISYVLKPRLPKKEKKKKKYLEWYNNKFEVTDNLEIKPKYYNYDIFKKPLKEYEGTLILDNQINFYMSPESGLYYGGRGGFGMSLLQNRKLFIELEDKLTKEIVIQLMYSKNPASRLTAIEYYYKHPELFYKEKAELDNWTKIVFKHVPKIMTLNGCIGGMKSSKELVKIYSEIKKE